MQSSLLNGAPATQSAAQNEQFNHTLSNALADFVYPNLSIPLDLPLIPTVATSSSSFTQNQTEMIQNDDSSHKLTVLKEQLRHFIYTPKLSKSVREAAKAKLNCIANARGSVSNDSWNYLRREREKLDEGFYRHLQQVNETAIREFWTPRIENLLRLLVAHFAPENLPFFHPPSTCQTGSAKKSGILPDHVFMVGDRPRGVIEWKGIDILTNPQSLIWKTDDLVKELGEGGAITKDDLISWPTGPQTLLYKVRSRCLQPNRERL